ncbi:MAG: hypothetical protein V9E96_16465 [Chitinophagaceae bacterium]
MLQIIHPLSGAEEGPIFLLEQFYGLFYLLCSGNYLKAMVLHYNFWYFLCFSILFIFANTVFSTPLIGLGYEMTTDNKERTRLMAFAQYYWPSFLDDCSTCFGY